MTSKLVLVLDMTLKKNAPFLETEHLLVATHLVHQRETSQVYQEVLALLVLLATLRNFVSRPYDTDIHTHTVFLPRLSRNCTTSDSQN
jgi:hypothetical protein